MIVKTGLTVGKLFKHEHGHSLPFLRRFLACFNSDGQGIMSVQPYIYVMDNVGSISVPWLL